jgi:hypothetical protein
VGLGEGASTVKIALLVVPPETIETVNRPLGDSGGTTAEIVW